MNNQNRKSELLDILSENLISGNHSIQNYVDFDESGTKIYIPILLIQVTDYTNNNIIK